MLDDTTLEVTLAQPTPYFLTLVAFQMYYPVPQQAVDMYGDSYGIFNSFNSGQLDYSEFPTKEDYEEAAADGTAIDALTGYMNYLFVNNSDTSILSDDNLRHALFYGFDRDSLTEAI